MNRVAGVVLAAGASTRLGEPKQLVKLNEERLLDRAVRVALRAGCEPVVVVLGAGVEEILRQCDLSGVVVVRNGDWMEGMASSIRAGVAVVERLASGALLMTCDQPAVTALHLRKLIEAADGAASSSHYAGRRGVPAYFPADRFAELLQLAGDQGAARLLGSCEAIDLPGGEIDVDTPAGLEQARQLLRGPGR